MPVVLKSGSLDLLKPSGPVQNCTAIALLTVDAVPFCCAANSMNISGRRKNITFSRKANIYFGQSSILPAVVISWGETWSLTLREEHRQRVFENRVLRRIFGPKRDGLTGEWRKLHNEELNSLYSSSNIVRMIKSRRMRWVGSLVETPGGASRND